MYSKNKKLTVYENNLLNVELINFIINSKNILSKDVKFKLLFEWHKTKWFIQNDLASLSERINFDYPGSLDALSVYINQKEIWPINAKIPWAYFVALKLGLKPESKKTWVLLHPANISLNMYQASLKIISNQKLDNERTNILETAILELGGEIFYFPEHSNIYLIKLPEKFNNMQSHFPKQMSQLSSHQFSSSDRVSKLWRTCMTEIEMKWYKLESNEIGANSMWAWGWGSMPLSLEHITKTTSQGEVKKYEDDIIISLMINGLITWLENKTQSNFEFRVLKTSFAKYNLQSLANHAKSDNNKEVKEQISYLVKDFTKTLKIFNKSIESNNTNISNAIYNDEFILSQKNKTFSNSSKLLLNFKSFLFLLHK